jgi:GDP-L-fucose synthase
LKERGYRNILVGDLPEYNLVQIEDARRFYDETKPDIVIHLAAKVAGIGFNQENPASLQRNVLTVASRSISEQVRDFD